MAKTEEKKTVEVATGGQYIKDLSFENYGFWNEWKEGK